MKMSIAMNQRDYNRVQTSLRTIAEKAPNHAARTLQRAGVRIMKRARDYLPEDTGALAQSIQVVKAVDNRRVIIDVVTGQSVLLSDGRSMPVEIYATIVHETYNEFAKNPSPATAAKLAKYPGRAGSHFLTHAMEDETKWLLDSVQSAITEVIEGEF